ncbi:MAG: TolC family protein [Gammaproteobacteria bacterium]|nr:TolC family protein [Gammaproteobacteria bacterium]
MTKAFPLIATALLFGTVQANENLSLPQALELALSNDPRIDEMEKYVQQARALKEEVEANYNLKLVGNSFVGFSPGLDGGFFTADKCGQAQNCQLRSDRYELNDGLSPWFYIEYQLVKPLNSFGKIENFADAAKENISVKSQDVRMQRGNTIYDVKRAYYGYLAARDGGLFLNDVAKRVDGALETVQFNLDEENGQSTRSDLYALQSAEALIKSYLKKSLALEQVAIQGLKVLIGVELDAPLELADKKLQAVELPKTKLDELTRQAMENRPEMKQLKSGLAAQNSLIKAKQAMKKPNLYLGFAGALSYSPLRDRVDNPHIYDPFNDVGATPLIGMQWNWEGSVQDARVKQAKAELAALMEKSRFAQRGIPYQVSEAYTQVIAHYESSQELMKSAKAARRWMISLFSDFQAGLQTVDKLVSAFQAYVLTYSEYLQTVYQYNLQVAQLEKMTGDYE